MLPNHLYNLMMQVTEESKSLKRIREQYLRDAEGHTDCVDFWQKMMADKEGHIEELSKLIQAHFSA